LPEVELILTTLVEDGLILGAVEEEEGDKNGRGAKDDTDDEGVLDSNEEDDEDVSTNISLLLEASST
jgi:hypothetical protein